MYIHRHTPTGRYYVAFRSGADHVHTTEERGRAKVSLSDDHAATRERRFAELGQAGQWERLPHVPDSHVYHAHFSEYQRRLLAAALQLYVTALADENLELTRAGLPDNDAQAPSEPITGYPRSRAVRDLLELLEGLPEADLAGCTHGLCV